MHADVIDLVRMCLQSHGTKQAQIVLVLLPGLPQDILLCICHCAHVHSKSSCKRPGRSKGVSCDYHPDWRSYHYVAAGMCCQIGEYINQSTV